ncbi:hypothetical protein [Nocardia jiangsuensis]|uniref:Uncharacterized protein n=1 Tax=Nocardia jiangsuensis TaxID=1691563 RepID=A0ABV8DXZ1_9NOCA
MSEPTGAVRTRLRGYLTDTLAELPAGSALVLRHPDLPNAGFHRGVTLPWNDSDPEDDRAFFDIAYWLLGPAPESADQWYDGIVRGWAERGWPLRSDRDTRPRGTTATTPDGYRLTVRQSVRGHLGVAGSTPPFPAGAAAGEPWPDRIDRTPEPRRELDRAAAELRAELLGLTARLFPGASPELSMLAEPAVLEYREPLRHHFTATLQVAEGGADDVPRAAAVLADAGWLVTAADDRTLTATRGGFRLRVRAYAGAAGLGISGETPGYVLSAQAAPARPEPVVTAATLRAGALLCYECAGLGHCPECLGRGWILDAERRRTRCVECRGARTCPVCAGAGQLVIRELSDPQRQQYPELDPGR